jgi:hypothetical protein
MELTNECKFSKLRDKKSGDLEGVKKDLQDDTEKDYTLQKILLGVLFVLFFASRFW